MRNASNSRKITKLQSPIIEPGLDCGYVVYRNLPSHAVKPVRNDSDDVHRFDSTFENRTSIIKNPLITSTQSNSLLIKTIITCNIILPFTI